jgi:hypothetical protein
MFWAEGEGYWEREPISWQEEGKEVRWTRAVKLGALGAEGEGKKARVSLLVRDELKLIGSGSTHSHYPLRHLLRHYRFDP